MGERGPKKRPTKLTILQGNPGRRPINEDEPEPEVFTGKTPKELPPAAKKIWNKYSKKLLKLGLLTDVDDEEFMKYCMFEAHSLEAEKMVIERGMVYPVRDKTHGTCPHCKKQVEIGRVQKNDSCYYCGETIETIQGNVIALKEVPYVTLSLNYANHASRIAKEFGMTPSARTGIKVDKTKQSDAEDFLFGTKKTTDKSG